MLPLRQLRVDERLQLIPPGPGASPDRALLWLTAAALSVRVAFLLLEPSCELTGDEPSWIALGTQELGRPGRGLDPLRNDLVFYPPVYPWLIAILVRAFGSVKAVLWVQALLGSLLVPAVFRAGALAFGQSTGLLAAAVTALWPELVWFAAHFWSETVFLTLLWWAIERTLAADAHRSPSAAAVAGLLWGLTTLTRELALYLVPIAALWMLRPVASASRPAGTARRPASGSLRRAAVLGLVTALTIAPWTIRNAIVFRAFIPVSTMGGLNLWQGNTTLTHLQIYERLATVGGPVEQDRFCRQQAWETIAARQPGWALQKLVEQMPEFWKPGSEVLDHLVGREACGPLPVQRLVPIELLLVLPFLAVLGLFLVGLACLRWSGGAGLLLLLLLAAYNAAHVVAYATTRFRLPVLPVVFMAAAAVVVGRRSGKLRRVRGWRAALLALLVLGAFATLAPGLPELATWRLLTLRP